MGMLAKKGKQSCLDQLSIKAFQSKLKLINSIEDVKSFIYDCIPELPYQW
jgi:hypothetical protein